MDFLLSSPKLAKWSLTSHDYGRAGRATSF